MKTSAIIADKLANAELVLNIDGGGGTLNEKTGKPEYFTWQGAEKTYADFQLTVDQSRRPFLRAAQGQRHRSNWPPRWSASRPITVSRPSSARSPGLFHRSGEIRRSARPARR